MSTHTNQTLRAYPIWTTNLDLVDIVASPQDPTGFFSAQILPHLYWQGALNESCTLSPTSSPEAQIVIQPAFAGFQRSNITKECIREIKPNHFYSGTVAGRFICLKGLNIRRTDRYTYQAGNIAYTISTDIAVAERTQTKLPTIVFSQNQVQALPVEDIRASLEEIYVNVTELS